MSRPRYRILRPLSRGGGGRIYLAMDEKLKVFRIVKEICRNGESDWKLKQQQFISEIRVFKELQHPYIPKILDIYTENDSLMLVMERIEGENLKHYIYQKGVADEETVVRWGLELANILSFLHKKNPPILHLDLKPSNVILHASGKLYLVDFGIAFAQKASNRSTIMGTKGFAAPEQFYVDKRLDGRADIYGFGKCLIFCLFGRVNVDLSCEDSEWKKESCVKNVCSETLLHFLQKCIAQDPEDRWQSMDDVEKELESILHFIEDSKDQTARDSLSTVEFFAGNSLEKKPHAFSFFRKKEHKIASFGKRCFLCFFFFLLFLTVGKFGQKINDMEVETSLNYARESLDSEKKVAYYSHALSLSPCKEESYDSLLEDYIESGSFTEEKATDLLNILQESGAFLIVPKENPVLYARFCYAIGLGFYEGIGGIEGKNESRLWFERVMEALSEGEAAETEDTEEDTDIDQCKEEARHMLLSLEDRPSS